MFDCIGCSTKNEVLKSLMPMNTHNQQINILDLYYSCYLRCGIPKAYLNIGFVTQLFKFSLILDQTIIIQQGFKVHGILSKVVCSGTFHNMNKSVFG